MSESQLVTACIKRAWYERAWLTLDRANSGVRIVKDASGNKSYIRGHKAGTADLMGYYAPNGRVLAVECKVGKNKQNEAQIAFQADIETKGGCYYLCYDLDQFELILKNLKS